MEENNTKLVTLDEQQVTLEVLQTKIEDSKRDNSIRIVEVSPGVYKTLQRLND